MANGSTGVWQERKSYENGVTIKELVKENYTLIAVFDGNDKVTISSPLRSESQVESVAAGYSKAKNKYTQ